MKLICYLYYKKGGLTSPTLFNMAVGNVVWHWLSITVGYDLVIRGGMGHMVESSMGVLYERGVLVCSQDSEWLQGDLKKIIDLFR